MFANRVYKDLFRVRATLFTLCGSLFMPLTLRAGEGGEEGAGGDEGVRVSFLEASGEGVLVEMEGSGRLGGMMGCGLVKGWKVGLEQRKVLMGLRTDLSGWWKLKSMETGSILLVRFHVLEIRWRYTLFSFCWLVAARRN